MAYKHPPTTMRTKVLKMLIFCVFSICISSCSKDDKEDNENYYTKEQLATLKVLHGSFSNTPDLMTGNIKTTFVFDETYLDKPKTINAIDYYGEKSERTVHGYLTYKIDYPSGNKYENQEAFYLHINGTDLTLYHINSDKTISLNSASEKYKVVIVNDNQIRMIDMDFPSASGQYYTRNY